MATGNYKNGVAIIVTYQAVNSATGKTVTMDVYDESHAKDVPKSIAAMTEIGTTGRYYATFTPDAEGEWIVMMKNTTDSNGEVVKAFAVAGHNIDSIGDAVASVETKVDTVDTVVDGIQTDVTSIEGKVDTVDTVVDGIVTDVAGVDGKIDTLDTVADGIQTDLSSGTYGLSAIKTAVTAIGSPAMVG
jgi:uncharacterized protein YoxC